MSISQLTRLLEIGEYRRCLEEASLLLATEGHDTENWARIQAAVCRSHLELQDYFAAVEAGQRATRLAEEAHVYDVLGFVLADLGVARSKVRQYTLAIETFSRFLEGLPAFMAARCMEGTVRKQMAWTLQQMGRLSEAQQRYQEARGWFERYGDVDSATRCISAVIRIYLDQDQPARAIDLLQDGERYIQEYTWNRRMLVEHLLDRALLLAAVNRFQESSREAFRALELADGEADQQCRSHLILCQNALLMGQFKDALNFVLGARVAAIDGRIYDLEFEASEILFRLLSERGAGLIKDLEEDYYRAGVDIFQYISKNIVDRMTCRE